MIQHVPCRTAIYAMKIAAASRLRSPAKSCGQEVHRASVLSRRSVEQPVDHEERSPIRWHIAVERAHPNPRILFFERAAASVCACSAGAREGSPAWRGGPARIRVLGTICAARKGTAPVQRAQQWAAAPPRRGRATRGTAPRAAATMPRTTEQPPALRPAATTDIVLERIGADSLARSIKETKTHGPDRSFEAHRQARQVGKGHLRNLRRKSPSFSALDHENVVKMFDYFETEREASDGVCAWRIVRDFEEDGTVAGGSRSSTYR